MQENSLKIKSAISLYTETSITHECNQTVKTSSKLPTLSHLTTLGSSYQGYHLTIAPPPI